MPPCVSVCHSQASREDVRTWVLSVVTDSSIEQQLPPRDKCRNTLYDGLFCSDRPTCIVTGYPGQCQCQCHVGRQAGSW